MRINSIKAAKVVPSGIEPLSEAPETSILSVELRDQRPKTGGEAKYSRHSTTPMTTPKAFSINFNIKRKSGKTSTIIAIVRVRGEKPVIERTGISVEVQDWNPKRQRCRTNHKANEEISKKEAEIRDLIKSQGHNTIGRKKASVLELIKRKKEDVEKIYSKASGKIYGTLVSNMIKFEEEKGISPRMDHEYARQFIEWASKKHADGHTNRLVTALKTVAAENGAPIGKVAKPKNRPKDSIYLNESEIEILEKYEAETQSEQKVKDMFLVLCYTGLRYVDLQKVTKVETIGNAKALVIKNKKTDIEVGIPAKQKLLDIIEKYKGEMKPFANQYLNRRIKEVARKAGLTKEITVNEYKGGKTIQSSVTQNQLITCHTGRRSFATNAVEAGIPMHVVMKFTGHKSISSFQKYLKNTWSAAVSTYQGHPFFS